MWEDDFDEEDFDTNSDSYEINDACILYVYENIREELRKKAGGFGIDKVFQYEKQFMDESKKLLEFGVQSGEEFEEDMVYYIQRNLSIKLILTVEEVTEILRVEEEYYMHDVKMDNFGIEVFRDTYEVNYCEDDEEDEGVYYLIEKAVNLQYVYKDYEDAKITFQLANQLLDEAYPEEIAFIRESLEVLNNPKEEETIDYIIPLEEYENKELKYFANYVRFFIEKGKLEIAKSYIDMLFEDAFIEGDLSIKSQILMYCYVHFYTDYPKAKVDLMKLIKDGIQCLGCDFSVNILRAKEKNHSEIDRVIEFAKRLTQSSPSLFDNQQLGCGL